MLRLLSDAQLVVLLVLGSLWPAFSLAQTDSSEPQWGPRLTPNSSPIEAAQWAVDYFACHDINGSPQVLVVRPLTPQPPLERPVGDSGTRPFILVVLAGDFNLLGTFPGFSGWAPYIILDVDLQAGMFSGISATSDVSPYLGETNAPLDVQPSRRCEHLPSVEITVGPQAAKQTVR
jgi:hypothetical protein